MFRVWFEKKRTSHTARLHRLELLGARMAMHGSGLGVSDPLPWFSPGELTYSFAPDGTKAADTESQLFESLNRLARTEEWQSAFAAAFSAWLEPLAASATEVSDSGDSFGTPGPTQHDLRFGDIRIGSIPLSQNILATSVPHSVFSQGTWAGDILLNSNAQWHNIQEVFAVALHEFGHVLGLPHSDNVDSVMFLHGVHALQNPSAEDIDNLQALYAGIPFEMEDDPSGSDGGSTGDDDDSHLPNRNFDPTNAIDLQPTLGQSIRYSVIDLIDDPNVPKLYRLIPTPEAENIESLTIVMRSLVGESLIPELIVLDANGKKLEIDVYHHSEGTVVIQVPDAANNETVYVLASSSIGSLENQTGAFELIADYRPETRETRKLFKLSFEESKTIFDSTFTVETSRLVHLRIAVDGDDSSNVDQAVWARLFDETGNVYARVAVRVGTTRTAPLILLPQGSYTLRMEIGARGNQKIAEAEASVFLDESSIDVGPGVVDPTEKPTLWCGDINADPLQCYAYTPISFVDPPIVRDPGIVYTDPQYPISYPWDDPTWWYIVPSATVPPATSPWNNPSNPADVSGDGQVLPQDALLVINQINRSGRPQIDVERNPTLPVTRFPDVNGDFMVSPLDALIIVNRLNRLGRNPPAGEGESGSAEIAAPPVEAVDFAAAVNEVAMDLWFGSWLLNQRRRR